MTTHRPRRTIRRWRATLAVLAFAGAAACAGLAPSAQAADGEAVTFGVQPSTAEGPDRRPFLTYGVTAGARVNDHVAVVNYSAQPVPLTVYASDAITTDDGGFGLLPGDEQPTDVGAWVDLGAPKVDVVVPPRTESAPGTVVLPVLITVPAEASPGDHVGGITAVLTSDDAATDGPNILLEQRVATRIYARVSGELKPGLTVDDLKATYAGVLNPVGAGSARVTYTVRNTGNVKLGGSQRVTVTGPLGTTASAVDLPQIPLLQPGGALEVDVEVPRVWPGLRLTATVDIAAGGLPGDQNPEIPLISASTSFWAIPWTLLAVLALLLAAGFAFWRRRATPAPAAPRPSSHRAPSRKERVGARSQ